MKRFLRVLLGVSLLLGLALLDHWVFARWFEMVHWRWYVFQGAQIGLATAIASLAWGDLNKNTGLIAVHPLDYLGSCLQMVGLPIFCFGTHSRSNPVAERALWDGVLAAVLGLVLAAALTAWVVVVVPLQYLVFLFCGGPSRYFVRSTRRPIARLDGNVLNVKDLPMEDGIPEGWWDASISNKPVAVTSLLSSLLLLAATWLLG